MENAQKAIMIGVGLFITLIIISAVMLVSSVGQDLMNSSGDQLTELSDSLSRQAYNDFAGSNLAGAQVIAAIKKYAGSNISVRLIDTYKSGALGGSYNITSTGEATNIQSGKTYTAANAGTSATDVVSSGKYKAYVQLDRDKKLVQTILFVRQ